MIFYVRRVRVTFVAIRTLYPAYAAQMTHVIIQIFSPFKRLAALIAVQTAGAEKSTGPFRVTNLAFLIADVPRVEHRLFVLEVRLVASRTIRRIRLRTGQLVPIWPNRRSVGNALRATRSSSDANSKHLVHTDRQLRMPSSDVSVNVRG